MAVFPLGKTGGLIEAYMALFGATDVSSFPLGKTGGLIEASSTRAGKATCGTCFRWVKPAASLKHARPRAGRPDVEPRFRWVKPAASLKLGVIRTVEYLARRVSAG